MRVELYLVVKSYSDYGDVASVSAALSHVCSAFSSQFELVYSRHRRMMDAPTFGQPIVELRRDEFQVAPTCTNTDYFYFIEHDIGDGTGWDSFWHDLPRLGSPIEISILFKPTELTHEEYSECSRIVSTLARLAESRHERDYFGDDDYFPADTNARMAYESWDSLLRKLQRCFLVRVAVRGAMEVATPIALRLASALGHSASEDQSGSALRILEPGTTTQRVAASESFDWLEVYPWGGHHIWHPTSPMRAPRGLRRFPYLFGLQDASSMAILPVPDDRGAPGFTSLRRSHARRQSISPASDSGSVEGSSSPRGSPASRQSVANAPGTDISLGRLSHYGSVGDDARVSLSDLNRHALVVGATGSGKTTTVLSTLIRLWRDCRIPFLVIEPTKCEYRSLLNVSDLDSIKILTVGREDICAFRLNLLEPPPGIRYENHRGSLMAMFKLALPIVPPIPELLGKALDDAFERAGWNYDSTLPDRTGRLRVPSLQDVADSFDRVFERQKYVGEAHNLGAAFAIRFDSMLRGSVGRVLGTVESNDFDGLLQHPVVVELDSVADPDEKMIIAAAIIDRVRAHCGKREVLNTGIGSLSHITVIEEAHRLIPSLGVMRDGDHSVRHEAVESFCNAIAELRSMGEGFIISSQSPSRLAPAAIANTGTRIVHRMESAEDRDALLADLDIADEDRALASRLSLGEAFFRSPSMDEAELIKVVPEDIDSASSPSDDVIKDHMRAFSETSRKLMPYSLCTRTVCQDGCDEVVRQRGQSIARDVQHEIVKAWEGVGRATSVDPAAEVLLQAAEKAGGNDVSTDGAVVAYCAASHLNAQRVAFVARDMATLRSNVIKSMKLD